MAIEFGITIFLVHHTKKLESGVIPQYEDLKESSSISQDCDKVLMIWRDFKKGPMGSIEMTGLTKLSVEVDRHSGTYKQHITLILKNKRFYEVDEYTDINQGYKGSEGFFGLGN